jgi:putative VCBS protein
MAEVKLPVQEPQVADSNETAKITPKEAMPAENAPVDMNKSAEEKPVEQKGEEPKEDNATISSLQKELLEGKDISELEETAAGGLAGGGNASGDGVSLGAANFVEGGHESSIYADYNALGQLWDFSFENPVSSVGGAAGEASNDFIVSDSPVAQPVAPTLPVTPVVPSTPVTPVVTPSAPVVTPAQPAPVETIPVTPTPAAPTVPTPASSYITISNAINNDGEFTEGNTSEPYIQYNYHITNAPAGLYTTNLKVDLGGQATKGSDYEQPEYSLDGGNTWRAIDPDMIIKNVEVTNSVVSVRVKVIDDNGKLGSRLDNPENGMLDDSMNANQNEGTLLRDRGADISPNIKDFGRYGESLTIKITPDNGLIESSETTAKIIDNDDYVKFTGDVNGNGKTLDTDNGEDKIYAKDGAIDNINIDMGGGDDVFMKDHSITSDGNLAVTSLKDTTIDMGDGNDAAIIAGADFSHSVGKESKVDLGSGDDMLIFNDSKITDAKILGGAGNDDMEIGNNRILDTNIEGGAGNDTIKVSGNIEMHNVNVLGGEGDDTISFTTYGSAALGGNTFDGGDGLDTLVVGNKATLMDNTNTYKNFERVDVSALGEYDAINVTNKTQLADLVDRFTNNGSHELTLVTSKDEGGFYHGNMYFHSEGGDATLGISPLPQGVTINPVDDKFYQINFEHNGADYTLKVQNEIMYSVAIYDHL